MTLQEFLDQYKMTKEELFVFLCDLDAMNAFSGGAYGPDDVWDNIGATER